jgi:hypothetical protein
VLLSADALAFVSFDADDDLRLTTPELEAGVAREWRRADRDNDGSLTPLEFSDWSNTALGGAQLAPFRLDFDRNVDNVISQTEFLTEFRARAEDYDANHDGVVSRAEMLRPAPQGRVRPALQPPPSLSGSDQDGPSGARPPR